MPVIVIVFCITVQVITSQVSVQHKMLSDGRPKTEVSLYRKANAYLRLRETSVFGLRPIQQTAE